MTKERLVIESMFQIADKEGRDVPFMLNTAQARLDAALTGRDIIPKARQEGVSSYVLALFTVRCLYKRNTRAVVISHDRESTERLFNRVNYYLEHIRGPKPVTGFSSKREFTFPKTGSMFYIGTAGARKFGRGDTITDLHCSEVAFWDHPKELFSGLSDAVPDTGTIILESTGNGKNWYYKRVKACLEGKSRYKLHFLDWLSFPEYDLEVGEEEAKRIVETLDPDLDEPRLYYEVGLTPGQIKFRRYKLEEKDFDIELFNQEYPMTLDDCFRSTGRSVFTKVLYTPTKRWQKVGRDLWALDEHPIRHHAYVMGVDVGGGLGQDNSVIEVVDLETKEQVAEWAANTYAPDMFAEIVAQTGREYNNAYVVVESNNHGLVTLDRLRNLYPRHLIYRKLVSGPGRDNLMDYGLLETSRLRPYVIGSLRRMLATEMVIHSPLLMDELDTFVENEETGKMEADVGCHDDRVMAMACLAYGFERAGMLLKPSRPVELVDGTDPFSVAAMIDELRGRRTRFPISPQVWPRTTQ